jgi:hypothetical protein
VNKEMGGEIHCNLAARIRGRRWKLYQKEDRVRAVGFQSFRLITSGNSGVSLQVYLKGVWKVTSQVQRA